MKQGPTLARQSLSCGPVLVSSVSRPSSVSAGKPSSVLSVDTLHVLTATCAAAACNVCVGCISPAALPVRLLLSCLQHTAARGASPSVK